jgi:hypothetical protein
MPSRLGCPVSQDLLTTSLIVCGHTLLAWLVLRMYMLADWLEDKPLDPCGPYYILLPQLWTSCDGGQVSKADYEWFCTCARTAMAEVAKVASAAASAPSVVPAVVGPTAAPVAPGPGPLPVVCSLPSSPASRLCQLLPIRVA